MEDALENFYLLIVKCVRDRDQFKFPFR